MPRVSVVCGAYNMENVFSFRTSLESILTQSRRDFELLICDDGSSDGTLSVLSEYARLDRRITVLKNSKNLGLAATLNRCIAEAKAPYIARHDLDDISHPDRLMRQIAFLDRHPDVCVLGCGTYLFDRKGVYAERRFPSRVRPEDYLFSSPFMHGAVIMRRDAFIASGGYRVERITRRAEDYDLFMRLALIGGGANLDEPLYYYLEDSDTERRRKYKYRIDEARVRLRGFRALGLFPRAVPYVIKPLAVGLVPRPILRLIKRKYYGDRERDG